MAVVREHYVDGAGNPVEVTGGGMDDDEGAPPAIAGLRVHTAEEADDAGTRPMTPEEIERFGATLPKPKKATAPKEPKAKAGKSKSTAISDGVSDRRRCLELAAATGETDPDQVLGIANKYLGFLEG